MVPRSTTSATPRSRSYRSDLRAQHAARTRERIVHAARDLFLADGWKATGMRDVATRAGVAVETVYAHFSSKVGLLRAVGDLAAVGDDDQIALADRPEFRAMGRGPRRGRIQAAAHLLRDVQDRTSGLARLMREAAPADPGIAETLRGVHERQRTDVAGAIALIVGRAATRTEVDGTWALVSPEVHLLLVDVCGWSLDEYEAWMAETLERVLPRA